MKKQIFLFAVAALALASCSSENDVVQTPNVVEQNSEPGAVMFDAYTNRATTRAGEIGSLTTAGFKTGDFSDDGFGVFGYYTNSSTYDQQAIPNFFYNQQVIWNTDGYFEYTPVKYWPNEYGTTAQSEDADKVSFFAYAPYIDVVPATGKPTAATTEEAAELQKWGISSLTRNNATGDPMVKYIASFDQDKSVDLCWGVCDDPDWRIIQTGGIQGDLNRGLPWLNVQRPADATALGAATGQKLKFTFKHATAQLKVNINAFVDGLDNGLPIASGTKVYVRSITFEGLATKGTLNLNNTEAGADKAYWLDYNGTNDLTTGESVTIYDGRKDGKEGTPSGIATNEKALGLNPDLVQSDVWANSAEGVTKDLKNLFRKYNKATEKYVEADQPIYVIPTGDPVKVTITYDIETADDNLSTYVSDVQQHGSSVENVITKEIDFGGTTNLENGKSYVINLHLGMNSVKFDAAVTVWDDGGAADVDLPYNAPTASVAKGGSESTTIPAGGGNGLFQVSGLTKDDALTYAFAVTTPSGGAFNSPTCVFTTDPVGNDGMAKAKWSIGGNNTVSDYVGTLKISAAGSVVGTLNITQKAHALALETPTINTDGNVITLTSGASGMLEADWATITVKRTRGGSTTTITPTKNASGNTTATLTLSEAAAAGDVYTITVDPGAGKAAAETVILKIGGIAFASASQIIEYGVTGFKYSPTVYGKMDAITYNVTSATNANVSSDGVVTTIKVGNQTIKASTSKSSEETEYQCTTNSVKAEYTLTVKKATGTISYPLENITAYSAPVDIDKAVLKNSNNNELTKTAAAGGAVTYSILSVDGDTSDTAVTFAVDGTELKNGSTGPESGRTYTVLLRAEVTENDNVSYTNKAATATITVTVP